MRLFLYTQHTVLHSVEITLKFIIIIFIYCYWVVTRWQWCLYMCVCVCLVCRSICSSTQHKKYQVSHKHSCFSWRCAHSRPKHVEIDKYIKNKLCTELALFTKICSDARSIKHKIKDITWKVSQKMRSKHYVMVCVCVCVFYNFGVLFWEFLWQWQTFLWMLLIVLMFSHCQKPVSSNYLNC